MQAFAAESAYGRRHSLYELVEAFDDSRLLRCISSGPDGAHRKRDHYGRFFEVLSEVKRIADESGI